MVVSVQEKATDKVVQFSSPRSGGAGYDVKSLMSRLFQSGIGIMPAGYGMPAANDLDYVSAETPVLSLVPPPSGASAAEHDEMLELASDIAKTYRSVAERRVSGISGSLHVVYDPYLTTEDGDDEPAREIHLAFERPDLAAAFARATGRDVSHLEALVVIGPDFAAWEAGREEFARAVGADISKIMTRLFPIEASGEALEKMTPFLSQLAGQVILSGGNDLAVRDRARQDAYMDLAERFFGHRNVECEKLQQLVPSWPAASQAVAESAGESATILSFPLSSMRACANEVRGALADGLSTLGTEVKGA